MAARQKTTSMCLTKESGVPDLRRSAVTSSTRPVDVMLDVLGGAAAEVVDDAEAFDALLEELIGQP